jgi:hypothetical protein
MDIASIVKESMGSCDENERNRLVTMVRTSAILSCRKAFDGLHILRINRPLSTHLMACIHQPLNQSSQLAKTSTFNRISSATISISSPKHTPRLNTLASLRCIFRVKTSTETLARKGRKIKGRKIRGRASPGRSFPYISCQGQFR